MQSGRRKWCRWVLIDVLWPFDVSICRNLIEDGVGNDTGKNLVLGIFFL